MLSFNSQFVSEKLLSQVRTPQVFADSESPLLTKDNLLSAIH